MTWQAPPPGFQEDPPPNGGKPNGAEPSAAPVEPFPFWRLANMRALKAPSYIVDRIIPDRSRTLIIAPSGHYKTMTAVDLVLSIAFKADFHGLAVEPMPIIYVANEDAYGVARQRILGWLDYHRHQDERIIVIPGDVLLNDPGTPARILATGAAAFPGQRFGVVLDTWDKSIGGDPDKTAEVVPAVMRTEELTKSGVCAFVLTLAHSPWSNSDRSKGSVTFWASQESRIKVERNDETGSGTLDVLHIKNGQPGLHLEFDYEVHEFGTESERSSTLIPIRRMDASERRQPKPKPKRSLGSNEKVVLDCLATALVDHGQEAPHARDVPPGTRVVTRARWQEVATRYLTQAEKWRREQAFDRALESLAADRFIRHAGDWFWLPRKLA
jgi:AAA domain